MTGDTLTIRPYDPADRETVVALWYSVGLGHPPNHPESDLDLAHRSGRGAVFVGSLAGRLAGTAVVAHDGHRGWIYYVAVAPDYRRRGFGEALVRHGEVWLARQQVPKMLLLVRDTNHVVRAFYEKLGYVVEPCFCMGRWLDDQAPGLSGGGIGEG